MTAVGSQSWAPISDRRSGDCGDPMGWERCLSRQQLAPSRCRSECRRGTPRALMTTMFVQTRGLRRPHGAATAWAPATLWAAAVRWPHGLRRTCANGPNDTTKPYQQRTMADANWKAHGWPSPKPLPSTPTQHRQRHVISKRAENQSVHGDERGRHRKGGGRGERRGGGQEQNSGKVMRNTHTHIAKPAVCWAARLLAERKAPNGCK